MVDRAPRTKLLPFALSAARIATGEALGDSYVTGPPTNLSVLLPTRELHRTISKAASPLFAFHCSRCNHTTTKQQKLPPTIRHPRAIRRAS
jgi:hypothetical protein